MFLPVWIRGGEKVGEEQVSVSLFIRGRRAQQSGCGECLTVFERQLQVSFLFAVLLNMSPCNGDPVTDSLTSPAEATRRGSDRPSERKDKHLTSPV